MLFARRISNVAQDVDRNEAAGQFSNMGIGLGMMAGVGGTVGGAVSEAFAGMGAVQPQSAANKFCDQCGAELTSVMNVVHRKHRRTLA